MPPPRLVRLKPGLLPLEKVFKRILVAIDGSDTSFRAAQIAARLASRNKAELIAVSVIQKPVRSIIRTPLERPRAPRLERYYAYASSRAEQWNSKVVALARDLGVNAQTRVLRNTSIVKAITDYAADEQIDLIVVGRKGTGAFKRLLVGSVSNGIVSHAACTVLVVR